MDLEERTRTFLAALGAGPDAVAPLLAPGAACEVPGLGQVDADGFLRWLAGPRRLKLTDHAVKRNVTFAWTDGGVWILSWDQDGRVAHLSLRD